MAHISINMDDMPIQVLDITPVNPLISKCSIKVCYVGQEANRNKSIITKEVATELAASIPGCPIVGFYNESKGDFEEHNRVIDLSNGKFQIKDTTRPYGFISMDAKVWFQWFKDDGIPHEYLCTEGYIWTGQYPESQRVIEKGNNQSMELDEDTLDAFWTKDNNGKPQFFIINEAIMSKLCILGEDVEPCFEGASIQPVQFSFEDDFKQKLYSLMEKMQEILSNEGGTPVVNAYAVEIGDALWSAIYDYLWMTHRDDEMSVYGIYEDGDQKFAILRSRKDLTYYRLNFSLTEENGFVPEGGLDQVAPDFKPAGEAQFALEAVEAYEAEYAKSKEEKETPEVVEEEPKAEEAEPAKEEEPKAEEAEPVEEEPVQEPVEEPVVESKPDNDEEGESETPVQYNLEEIPEYQELLRNYSELEGKVAELNSTIETLTATNKELAAFKLEIDREKKRDLINNTFYMLSDDQKKDCLDNIDNYSYDDIEAKLSVICVRNKVSFNLDTPEEEKPVTYNIDTVDETEAGLPAWVLRVLETQKNL